jgi:hypothetical protein
MSDSNKPAALPGPGADQGDGAARSTPLRGPRAFAPKFESRYRNEGISEREGLAELQRRRGEAPGSEAQPTRLRSRPSGPALPADQGGTFSPLTSVLDEAGDLTAPQATAPDATSTGPFMPQPGPPGDPVFDLTFNGQPQRVALSELIRGYMRNSDYTTKTQANAQQLRQAQEAVAAFTNARVALEARLPSLIAAYSGEFERPVDWVKLAAEDPIGYAQKDARYKQFQAAVKEQRDLAELRGREDLMRKQEMRRLGHEFLMAVLPGWRDPATRQQLQLLQTQHLRAVGFTPEEIEQTELLDPRHIIILEESRRFRALVAAHPELLRSPSMRPVPPARRGDMPQPMAGNGRLDRQSPQAGAGDAERRWQELPVRSGAAAREAAVSLIAARRHSANGANPLAPLRGRRS